MALSSSSKSGALSSRSGGFWPQWQENKLFALLLAILLVYGIVYLGANIQKTMLEMRIVGVSDRQAPYISVSATESSSAVPDLATVDFGITVSALTSDKAQDDNAAKVNALLAGLKELGIEDKDLKTSYYNLYPQYDYDQSPARVVGYEASQTITVRIRNQELVSSVIEKAGDLGATNIGSLRFEVDDASSAEAEARERAIAKAYEEALAIADAMGAELGSVVSYSELKGSVYPPVFYESVGRGGGAPAVAPGENEVQMTVNIEFALE